MLTVSITVFNCSCLICLHLEKSLTVHNILEVLNTGEFPAANCEELGLALDIKKYVLHNILSNRRGQVTLQLADIFEHWLNNDLEASWDKVADALEKCGYKKLAYIISGKMKEPSMQARDEDLTTVPRYIEGMVFHRLLLSKILIL